MTTVGVGWTDRGLQATVRRPVVQGAGVTQISFPLFSPFFSPAFRCSANKLKSRLFFSIFVLCFFLKITCQTIAI